MIPFTYPSEEHQRLHGPGGYESYESYRPWLRDEFLFRCVYCLKREQWGHIKASYSIDHFLPQAMYPDLRCDYDNLLYSCATCNAAKGDVVVPNPCDCLLEDRVIVSEDGSIEGADQDAQRLIRILGLDDPEYCEFRRLWIGIVALVQSDANLFRQLMKYPDNLPDLSKLRPKSNTRPEGVGQSCHARRRRDELPETY